MIDLIAYNKSCVAVGIIDTEISLMWERRFYDSGYFELHVPATDNNNKLLKQGYYIMHGGSKETGYIQYIRKETDEEGKAEITAIGRFLSYILHGHIVQGTRTFRGNAETIMRGLVSEVVMNPETIDYIPEMNLGQGHGSTATVDLTLEYPDLLDALKEISRQAGLGFIVSLDPGNNKFYFEVIVGLDKSVEQSTNSRVIFSPNFDTINGNATLTEDDTDMINVVTMRYVGEAGTVVVRYNPGNARGRDIHEIYNESSECVMVEGVINRTATEALLTEKAKELLREKTTVFEASVSYTGGFVYKTDYDIGDIVTVEYPAYDTKLTQRIHKIVENYTDAGMEIIPVCGEINPKGEDL